MLEEDEPLLRQRAKECKDAKEAVRYYALHAISEGKTITEVASIFLVQRPAVYDWIEKWQKNKDLSDEPRSGRPPAFDEKEKKELKKLVDEDSPENHGLNASFWDCGGLRKYYLSIGKNVSEDAIRNTLLSMGARYIKAQIEYKEADLEKQRVFALEFLEDFQKLTADIALLFEDEMSACTSPHKGYGWTFNQRLIVRAAQKGKERLNCFGVTNPITGKRIQLQSTLAKAPALIEFLDKVYLTYRHKREIWLYLDSGPVHKSKLFKEWTDKHPTVKIKRTPTYSPDINPQELVWGYDRKKYLNNRPFDTAEDLSKGLDGFVRSLKPTMVRRICSLIPIEMFLSFQV